LKYLIIFCLVGLTLIYMGNYYDLKRQKITHAEYNRRFRFTYILVLIVIAILLYLRKR
jgi:hypothetical protein